MGKTGQRQSHSAMIYGIEATKASQKGWSWDKDVQYTTSTELILKELKALVRDATWIEIRTPGYRSAPTVLIAADERLVKIDMPVDWKGAEEVVLTYRRRGEPWNFLKARVLTSEDKALYLDFPTMWAILERREYFRIQCPTGSMARCFPPKGAPIKGLVKDVSLQGLCLELPVQKGERPPKVRELFDIITISLRLAESQEPFCLDIKKGGEIRRIQSPGRFSKLVYRLGIRLFTDEKEREFISYYIRKRELELLKVMKDT